MKPAGQRRLLPNCYWQPHLSFLQHGYHAADQHLILDLDRCHYFHYYCLQNPIRDWEYHKHFHPTYCPEGHYGYNLSLYPLRQQPLTLILFAGPMLLLHPYQHLQYPRFGQCFLWPIDLNNRDRSWHCPTF